MSLTLPVLLYHHVGPRVEGALPGLTTPPNVFERQIRWLAFRGYQGIRPVDWLRWHEAGERLPRKPVIVTFDDGYADIAEYALPVLRRYGFSGAIFVVTALIGKTNNWDKDRTTRLHPLMSAEQIRLWSDQGFEVGSHSRTHSDLTQLTGFELRDEIAGSAVDLRNILGREILSFAYPYGSFNSEVRDCVRTSFKLAFTVKIGVNNPETQLDLLKRIELRKRLSLIEMESFLLWGKKPADVVSSKLRRLSQRSNTGRVQKT